MQDEIVRIEQKTTTLRGRSLAITATSGLLAILIATATWAQSPEQQPDSSRMATGSPTNRLTKGIPHPISRSGESNSENGGPRSARTLSVIPGQQTSALSTWVSLVNQMPGTNDPLVTPGEALLLTDGRVMAQDSGTGDWWLLTPDSFGSYVNGTWTQAATMPYAPLYFASAVLPDGRVLVEGGEYVDFALTWTNQGAIYDPASDTWQSVAPPEGWFNIGDAQSVVLANGTFMLANAFTTETALFDAHSLTWSPTGTGKATTNDEEGWTLLSSGKVLTVDSGNFDDPTHSELYNPATGSWSSAGSTGVQLVDFGPGSSFSFEIGPQVLRPDGTVFVAGATGHTAIYDSKTGRWTAGPDFPLSPDGQLDVADGPAALLPNGNVLVAASPGIFNNGTRFFEFDGRSLTEVASRPDAANHSSFEFFSLVLPTGEILVTNSNDGNGSMVYASVGGARGGWAPEIESAPDTIQAGNSYTLTGSRLNGLSQGAAYGDDAQSATNYPLVRITNRATGHVFYARTHDHSSMAIGLRAESSTQFDVPANIEAGPSKLTVVTNGIPSESVRVVVVR